MSRKALVLKPIQELGLPGFGGAVTFWGTKEGFLQQKYMVRWTDDERQTLRQVVRTFKGSSQKVRRAQILLQADADGPAWTEARIAEAFGARTRTVANIRHGPAP